jgi:hypothetical protein
MDRGGGAKFRVPLAAVEGNGLPAEERRMFDLGAARKGDCGVGDIMLMALIGTALIGLAYAAAAPDCGPTEVCKNGNIGLLADGGGVAAAFGCVD